jgi:hypothetical protein
LNTAGSGGSGILRQLLPSSPDKVPAQVQRYQKNSVILFLSPDSVGWAGEISVVFARDQRAALPQDEDAAEKAIMNTAIASRIGIVST